MLNMSAHPAKRPCLSVDGPAMNGQPGFAGRTPNVNVTFEVRTFLCGGDEVAGLPTEETRVYSRNSTSEGVLLNDIEAAFLNANPRLLATNPHIRVGVFLVDSAGETHRLHTKHASISFLHPSLASVFHRYHVGGEAVVFVAVVNAQALLNTWCEVNNITNLPRFTDWDVTSGLPDIMEYVHAVGHRAVTLQQDMDVERGHLTEEQAAAIRNLYLTRPEVFTIDPYTTAAFTMLREIEEFAEEFRYPLVNVLVRRIETTAFSQHWLTTQELRMFKDPRTTPATRERILTHTIKPALHIVSMQ